MGFKKLLNVCLILFISLSSILKISSFVPNQIELDNNSTYVNDDKENKKADLVIEDDAIILQPNQTSAVISIKDNNNVKLGETQITFDSRTDTVDSYQYDIKMSIWNSTSSYNNYYLNTYDAQTNQMLKKTFLRSLHSTDYFSKPISFTHSKTNKYIKINISATTTNDSEFYSPFFYLYVHEGDPTIENFSVTNNVSKKSSSSSINASWTILDPGGYIDTIQIINAINNQVIADIPQTMLTATNYLITDLEANQNYSLSLVVNWSDDIIDLYDSVTMQVDIITDAQIPIINDFELINTSENSAIIQISYEDPDSIVDTIILHDKNGIINDIILSPSDLTNGRYEIQNLEIGDYDLELTLHWTSKAAEDSITWPQSLNFSISNISTKSKWWLWLLISIIILAIVILLILFILKWNKKNKNNIDNQGENKQKNQKQQSLEDKSTSINEVK